MLTQKNAPASQAGEDQASGDFAARLKHHKNTWAGIQAARLDAGAGAEVVIAQAWSVKPPAVDNSSLTAAILEQKHKMLAGDVLYVTEVRRHVVTDADLNAAAHAVIGGAQ